ncbi:MAG: L,D-transpeptidase family protein [Paracoccaceae bacterium]|nr:L,D-transpeptidase family protein [Paracoccaceae bacterium]
MEIITNNYILKRVVFVFFVSCWFLVNQWHHVSADEMIEIDFSDQFVNSDFENFVFNGGTEDTAIIQFYTDRSFHPFWYGDLDKINEFKRAVDTSEIHGLPHSKYEFLRKSENTTVYEFEILVMKSFISLISDLNSVALNPSDIDNSISVYPKETDKYAILSRLEEGRSFEKNLKDFVFSYAPKTPEYSKLLNELARLRGITINNGWGKSVPEDKFLGYNLTHPNVGSLRTRLFNMGYLTFDSGSNLYDGEIKSAIQLFQADHGLNDDGVAGNYTLQAINVSSKTRLIQVLVNLERIRWADFKHKSRYILVNQPNFQAYLIEDDNVVWQSRVVIGLPEHQTQEFSDVMTHLIINPVWHVPRSISTTEYLPIIQENPEFLEDNDMSLIVRGTDQEIDPNLIDMSQFEPDNFPFLIKQNPSNTNALGVVKFMFPNEFNIYMHDTPMKELFFKDERTFSHGCVRVQDPFQFAFNLLGYQEENPQKKFQKVLQSKQESQINLEEPIPVSLIYRTVFFSDYGQPQYRSDIYGRDAAVFMALQDAGVITQI